MRLLQITTIAMGVLILLGTAVLIVVFVRRLGPAGPVPSADVVLSEPAGTHIAAIAAVGDRLAVQLQGGGEDRVLLLDAHSGAVVGRVGLRSSQ